MRKKKLLAFAMILIVMFNLVSCGNTSAGGKTDQVNTDQTGQENAVQKKAGAFPGTTDEDTVVLDITTEPVEMNSILVCDAVAMSILSHCMSGIARLDKNDEPVADLAEKWDISADNTKYVIYLKQNAKWSNGEPVTAKDFYFAWVTQMKPDTGAFMASFLYENIKNGEAFYNGQADESELGIKVRDDYTLEIEWSHPMTDGLFLLALPMYFPMNQKAYEEIGAAEYGKDADKMVTNGAYRLTEWTHDDHMMLEKWDDYYNASDIRIPKVKLAMIGDTNTRLNAFTTGEIDLCNIYSEQIAQVKDKDEKAIHTYIDGGTWYLGFNMENEYLANENIRKALAYSIDTQSLLDNVIADGSVAADGLVPEMIAGAGEKSYASARGSLFAYDLENAKKYMELALEELKIAAADIKLTLDVVDTSYSQNQAAYIQQQWKTNLGIDVTINAQAWKALQEAKENGDFNISIEANGPTENTAMTFLEYFASDNVNNMGKYSNPEYDRLLADADEQGDAGKKQELMIQAEKLLLDDMAMGPLYFTCTTYAVSDKVEGLVRTPFQYFNVCGGASINAR
ncbi:peptide ABC transporter substrate-binding protein [Robinsoniella peoriensis]|uniref:peptide ABC transporter substrate-binding protein n=1 Tax=Robinsoniella peoriensis TaxID=180332 RepID=UPI00085C8C42|nr:peptide ABC transporter substrate-binding protein [Robinsoniella peoriensis]